MLCFPGEHSVTNIFVKTYMFFQDILAYLWLNRNFIQTGPFRKPHKHMASYWTKACQGGSGFFAFSFSVSDFFSNLIHDKN